MACDVAFLLARSIGKPPPHMDVPPKELLSIAVDGRSVECRFGRIPSIEDEVLARVIDGAGGAVRSLAASVTGVLLDLRWAPNVLGPQSIDALGRVLAGLQSAGVTTAAVVGNDPTQRLQISRLIAERAPRSAAMYLVVDLARAALEIARAEAVKKAQERAPWMVTTGVRPASRVIAAVRPTPAPSAPAAEGGPDPWKVPTMPGRKP